jgi:hypothetical protein
MILLLFIDVMVMLTTCYCCCGYVGDNDVAVVEMVIIPKDVAVVVAMMILW